MFNIHDEVLICGFGLVDYKGASKDDVDGLDDSEMVFNSKKRVPRGLSGL